MKRYITGIIAVVMSFGIFAFAKSSHPAKQSSNMLEYYFKFVGSHGDESDTGEWQEISKATYDSLSCLGSHQGCKITTTSVSNPSATFGQRIISSVTVDGNDVPLQTMDNTEVKNKP